MQVKQGWPLPLPLSPSLTSHQLWGAAALPPTRAQLPPWCPGRGEGAGEGGCASPALQDKGGCHCSPPWELPRACSCVSLHDHNSLRIKIPGIVPAGLHAGNCLLLNLPLKISQGTGAACPCGPLRSPASRRGRGALWGAGGGETAAFLPLFRNFMGKTSELVRG